MALGPLLGPYEVTAQIGAGGMGEVHRAHDTKLNRDVALKVLPEAFTADADRLARFKREAQVLAALNHPGIAAIYGFEDSSATQALVMELVEGPTLADRIAGGPIEDLVSTEFDDVNADVSPNGRWVAYESNRRGTAEVYVSPFPDASSGLTAISSGGGKWFQDPKRHIPAR